VWYAVKQYAKRIGVDCLAHDVGRTCARLCHGARTLNHSSAVMVSLFAVLAFVLATTSLYATVPYSFAQRRFELAIRAALATPSNLLTLVFTER
jgi:hypothetical protein